MTAKDWLAHLASLMAQRFPGNRSHLSAYAGPLAAAVPAHWLTPEMAEAVEPRMLDRMKLAELVSVLRLEGAHLPAAAPGASASKASLSDEELKAEIWFGFAQRRLSEEGAGHLPHLLSLLRAQSPIAWRRFAEIHDPEAVWAEDDMLREISDRRKGLLPPLRVTAPRLRHIEGPQGRHPVQRADAEDKPVPRPMHLTPEQERIALARASAASPGREGDALRFRLAQLEQGA